METMALPARGEQVGEPEKAVEIDATGLTFKELNDRIRDEALGGAKKIILRNVYGQRYIATRLNGLSPVTIEIYGVPGNDLGAFNDGHRILVHGNAQDGVGNTMHGGEIVVEGRVGDVLAMSMTEGTILVRDNAGYRCALHMKEYGRIYPIVVVGRTTQDFLGEYMAGGRVIVLGIGVRRHRMSFIGTGMHGGTIYIYGRIAPDQLGRGLEIGEIQRQDEEFLKRQVERYIDAFGTDPKVDVSKFTKLVPKDRRPYSSLYS